jgi:hypothetical protein
MDLNDPILMRFGRRKISIGKISVSSGMTTVVMTRMLVVIWAVNTILVRSLMETGTR